MTREPLIQSDAPSRDHAVKPITDRQRPLNLTPLDPLGALEGGAPTHENPVSPLELDGHRPIIIGRSEDANWPRSGGFISRTHASFESVRGAWYVTDLDSRHGTTLNGQPLTPHRPQAIRPGDLIAFGGWRCRVRAGDAKHPESTAILSDDSTSGAVTEVPRSDNGALARRQVDALLDAAGAFSRAESLEQIATAAVEAFRRATGLSRVAMLRRVSTTEFELIAPDTLRGTAFSRSLLEHAEHTRSPVTFTAGAPGIEDPHSIVDLAISKAVAAPVLIGDETEAVLTADTRQTESLPSADAAAVCAALASQAGLALARLRRNELADANEENRRELINAQRAQRLLMPPPNGTASLLRYTYRLVPGSFVAGDFFDIFTTDNGAVVAMLGDVMGHGAGAGVVMAATQSLLRARLAAGNDLSTALATVNNEIYQRTEPGMFVTLAVASIDPADRSLIHIADAGHGHMLIKPAPGKTEWVETPEGQPLGVSPNARYPTAQYAFNDDAALVLFTDGVEVRHTAPVQNQGSPLAFGRDDLANIVAQTPDCATIPEAVLAAVTDAASGRLQDDVTVAVISK